MPAGANKSPSRNLTPDGEYIGLGKENDVAIGYDRADANAGAAKVSLPAAGVGGVPVVVVGVNIDALDLGTTGPDFAGFTQPMVATVDLDRDSYVGFHYSSDDVAVVRLRLANGTVRNHTIPDVASDTFTLNDATQTLTNKTLTTGTLATPVITDGTLTNPIVTSGTFTNPTIGTGTFDSLSVSNIVARDSWMNVPLVGGWTTALSGSGTVLQQHQRLITLQTGASASGTALARNGARSAWHQAQQNQVIDFSKRIEMSMVVSVIGTSGGTGRLYLGAAGTVAALGTKAVGVEVRNTDLFGIVHDGGSAASSTLSTSITGTNGHRLLIRSYGNGTVEWLLNGTVKGSSVVGPTGSGAAGFDGIQIDVQNGTGTGPFSLNVHEIKSFFAQ